MPASMVKSDARAPVGFAGLASGLVLALIHLVGIPVTNTSVNPAPSLGPAVFAGGLALSQLWLFIVAPLLGGATAAAVCRGGGTSRRRHTRLRGPGHCEARLDLARDAIHRAASHGSLSPA